MKTPPAVRLANDIAVQFENRPHDEAVEAVVKHIRAFWDPRMRQQLVAYAAERHVDLSDLASEAGAALSR